MHLKNVLSDPALEDYDVNYYELDLSADNTSNYIEGSGIVFGEVSVPSVDTLVVELDANLMVDSVWLDNSSVTYLHQNDKVYAVPVSPYNQGMHFSLRVFYHGTPDGGLFNEQYIPFITPYITYTLSEPFHAFEWFPCKQDLTDKADSVCVKITTSNDLKAGSNGVLRNTYTIDANTVCYEWFSGHPTDFYLISLSIGPYEEFNQYAHPAGLSDSVFIQNYVYDLSSYSLGDVEETAGLIELFSELYGMYPFADEKYGHCMAPLSGGMEHQTMTTLGYFETILIAHELAHQWFGDYLTCGTWQDIWINEGFASYSEYITNQNLVSQAEADAWMLDAHSYAKEEPQGSVYVPITEVNDEMRIFSMQLSYKKGAALVHMIRYLIDDDDMFYAMLRDYIQTFANSTATGEDFKIFASNYTGIDFTDFFNEWYYGEGFPTYSLSWWQADSVYFEVSQTTSSSNTPLFTIPVEFTFNYTAGGDTTIRFENNQQIQSYSVMLGQEVSSVEIDKYNWILNNEGSINYLGTGNFEHASNTFVYPNPCRNEIRIQYDNTQSIEYSLFDSSMRMITNGELNGPNDNIKMNSYDQGIYFLRLNSKEGSKIYKIVKN